MQPVVVLGPHRSGTSVTTRVVSLLGPSLCAPDDRLAKPDNPTGHWESRTMMALGDELLERLGGFWWAPPEATDDQPSEPDLDDFRRRAAEAFREVHPAEDWVWKDPRLCLALPFWTAALDVEPVCVLCLRHPSEAAASLAARDDFGPRHALALWEWYAASMLRVTRGRPVAVVRYRRLVTNPVDTVTRLAEDLAAMGVEVTGNVDAAAAFIDAGQRHHRAGDEACRPSSAQQDLHRLLDGLEDRYNAFPGLAPPPTSRTTVELLAVHRRFQRLQVDFEERTEWALAMKRELEQRDATILAQQEALESLHAEYDDRTRWAQDLERELERARDALRKLSS